MTEKIPLYGSHNSTYSQSTYSDTIGKRNYELTNHLGNVLSVISDKPIPYDDANDSDIDWFLADIRQSTDYSAFGVQLENRNFTKNDPVTGLPLKDGRFGFQGQEEDDQIKGEGNSLNFEYRMHDTRLGRWLSIDPEQKRYPNFSPYVSMGNNPVVYFDIKGDVIIWGTDMESQLMRERVETMCQKSNSFNTMVNMMKNTDKVFNISVNDEFINESDVPGAKGIMKWDGKQESNRDIYLRVESSNITMVEELFHGFQSLVYEFQKKDVEDDNSNSRKIQEFESEANLMQIFVMGEIQEPVYTGSGGLMELADDKFFDALKKNQYLVTENSAVESNYYDYIDLYELLNAEEHKAYQGKQEKLLPDAFNKVIKSTIVTNVNTPETGVSIVAPKEDVTNPED